jgi:RNA polymerase sigma factor (TIGR02999 family)
MTDVTQILAAIEQVDPHAAGQLLPLVYDSLRELAAQRLAPEKPGQTLQATALIHEAYLRLVGGSGQQAVRWDSRRHFVAAAAEAMRWILIDSARREKSRKGGGARRRVELDAETRLAGPDGGQANDLLALNEAPGQLEAVDQPKARLVKLRYFAGLSVADAAEFLGISPVAAKRDWVYARSWLCGEIRGR